MSKAPYTKREGGELTQRSLAPMEHFQTLRNQTLGRYIHRTQIKAEPGEVHIPCFFSKSTFIQDKMVHIVRTKFAPKGPRERTRINIAKPLELLRARARMAENTG